MYEGDAPLAERRAQALTVDPRRLRALLGEAELRQLLDPEAILEVERDLVRAPPLEHADAVHDLLLRRGDLALVELARHAADPARLSEILTGLIAERRVLELVAAEAELEFVDVSPSAPPLREHPLVSALAESGVVAVEPKQAWTDVARFAELGIPAVNFGPGVQAQAHQRNEWTLLSQLDVGLGVLELGVTA